MQNWTVQIGVRTEHVLKKSLLFPYASIGFLSNYFVEIVGEEEANSVAEIMGNTKRKLRMVFGGCRVHDLLENSPPGGL